MTSLLDQAMEIVNQIYGDRTVLISETIETLEELVSNIEVMISTLDDGGEG